MEIPVLDLGPLRAGEPGALERLGAELREAFTEVGFYFVRNHGISQALTKFEPALRSAVKAAGFLTRDPRVVERKKYGKAKARKSFQFSKR